MSDSQTPAPAPSKGMNPILKWLLIGCGTLMMLVLASCVLLTYACKKGLDKVQADLAEKGVKVDTSHGFKGMAYSMAVSTAQGMKPAVVMALPPAEQGAADKAFADLVAKGGSFNDQDMHDLSTAIEDFNKANKVMSDAGKPPLDPDAARKFVKDIQALADRH